MNKPMNRGKHVWSGVIAIAIVLMLASMSRPAFARTGSNTEYALAGKGVVEWSDPWQVDERTSGYSQDAAGDVVTLLNGDNRFTLTTYPGIVTPVEGRDALLDQYQRTRDQVVTVDAGESGSIAMSSLVFADTTGAIRASYSSWSLSADGRTLIGAEVVSPIGDIETALSDAQAGITIDRVAVLVGADSAAISKGMAGAESSGATAAPATKTTNQGGSTDKLDPVFVEAGLLTDESYKSPQFGYAVDWTSPWVLNPDDTEAVISNTSSVTDALYIAIGGPSYSLLAIAGVESGGSRPADLTAIWASQEFLDQYSGAGTTILLEDSAKAGGAVVTIGPLQSDESSNVVTVRELVSLDGGTTFVFLTLIIPVEEFAAVYDSVQSDVMLNGKSAMGFFSTNEIIAALP